MKNFCYFSMLMMILFGCSSFLLDNDGVVEYNWTPAKVIGILLIFLVVIIIVKVSQHFEKKRTKDPLTSGSPSVPGGISDNRIYRYFRAVLRKKFPGKSFEIRIFKGVLSGDSTLDYLSGVQKLNLFCVDAFYGEIKVNDRFINPICILRDNGVLVYQGECKGFYFQEVVMEDGTTVPYK